MATPLNTVSALIALFCILTVDPISAKLDEEKSLKFADSINEFSSNFYEKVAEANPGKNLVMSPFSLHTISALLTMGAKSETLNEINKALHLPDVEFTKAVYKPTVKKLKTLKGIELKTANAIYVKDSPEYELSPEFQNLAVRVFSSDVKSIDFTKSNEAAKEMNTWIEEQTNDKIKNLIRPNSLDDLTRLVLINAIYFKGEWNNKFDAKNTNKQDFHLDKSNKIQVDMMYQSARFLYGEIAEWDAKMIVLPYVGIEASMVIVLPNQIEGLEDVERKIVKANLTDYIQNLENKKVKLSLPKFKIETELKLKPIMEKLGMMKMFSASESDLSGVLKNPHNLFVSDAIQKAFIEVNERGTEAAAATVFHGLGAARITEIYTFNADHPFYYSVRDNKHNILFSGRIIKF